MIWKSRPVFFLLIAALLATPLTVAFATIHTVECKDGSFSPAVLHIDQGDTVKWINVGLLVHTVTSGTPCMADGKFNSGDLLPGQEYTYTFATDGTKPYFCMPHCVIGMSGQVIVAGPVPVKDSTWGKIKALYNVP